MNNPNDGQPNGSDPKSSSRELGETNTPSQPRRPTETNAKTPREANGASKPPRRRLWRNLGIVAGVLVVLGLIIHFVPSMAVRYVIDRELAKLGISTDGVKTININPWQRRFSVGPVKLGGPDSDPAVINELVGEIRLYRLLYQQAAITSLIIEGVDIAVVLNEDSDLLLNGISLGQFIAPPEEGEAAAQVAEEDAEGGWGAGLDLFELRNSQMVFDDVSKGDIKLNVERLTLRDFRTWEPDNPGTFEFVGTINNIPFEASGEARPFGDQQVINVDAKMTDVQFDRIAQYTGPLGLDRKEGTLNLDATSNIIAGPDDRIEVGTNVLINMAGADFDLPDKGGMRFSRGTLDILSNYVRTDADGDRVSGTATLELSDGALASPAASGGFSTLSLATGEFDVRQTPQGQLTVVAKPTLSIGAPRVDQPVVFTADSLDTRLSALNAESSGSTSRLRMTAKTALANASMSSGSTTTEGSTEVTLTRLEIDIPDMALNVDGNTQSLKGALSTAIKDLAATLSQAGSAGDGGGKAKTVRITAGSVALDVPALDGTTTADTATMDVSADAAVDGLAVAIKDTLSADAASESNAIDLSIDSINLSIAETQLRKTAAETGVSGSATTTVEAVNAKMAPSGDTPAVSAAIGSIDVEPVAFEAAIAPESLSWSGAFSAVVAAIEAALDDGEAADVTLDSVTLTNAQMDQGMAFVADSFLLNNMNVGFTDRLFAGRSEEAVAEEAEEIASPPTIEIGRFAVENGGKVRFSDGSTSPPTKINLDIATLEATNINSRDTSQKTDLTFDGKLNEFTQLNLAGWAMPFADQKTFDLKGKTTNVQLVTFSPYAAKAIGMHLESGSLDADVGAKANADNLSGVIDLGVADLGFSALSAADAVAISAKVGLPIETAVGLLQDSQGKIDLKLPISGTVADPEVDYSEAIGKAVSGALTSIFPPTAIANLLISAADGAGAPTFKPIAFAPGSVELTPEAAGQVDNLVELLTDRPKLKIKVCGRATASDFEHYLAQPAAANMGGGAPAPTAQPDANATPPAAPAANAQPPADSATAAATAATAGTPSPSAADTEAFRQKYRADLADLAMERGRAVRRYIVEKIGGNSSAVGECRSAFDPLDNEAPRVQVTL